MSRNAAAGEASRPVKDRVFVAVNEENGRSTLLWALQNLAKHGTTIVIAHVRRPSQAAIAAVGTNQGREEEEKQLAEYEMMCRRRKISREEVIIEKDDVAKALEELIAHSGITKLVVGAAADGRYSNALFSWSRPWSKTALRLMDSASNSCSIWFTCKGHLVCTRQGGRNVFATPPSPTEQALREAQLDLLRALKKKEDWKILYQREVTKSQAAEKGLLRERQKEDWKILYQREVTKSQAAEKRLLRERQKVQEIEGQLEAVYTELDDAQELKQQIKEARRARKGQEEQLAASRCILEILQDDNLELQQERDAAVAEAEDLRRKCRLSALDDAPAPPHFVCPIYLDVMEDPHVAADGFTYEGEAIREWLKRGRDTSPMTKLRLAHKELLPNRTLRSAILEWKQRRRAL